MGRGKLWTSEECQALARAWINVAEDKGSADVKGTDQNGDDFWKRIVDTLQQLSPPGPDSIGKYHQREVKALRCFWNERLCRDIRKFNKSIVRVQSAHLPGVDENQKISIAISMVKGKIGAPCSKYKHTDPSDWMFYRAWLVLKHHVSFLPPKQKDAIELDEDDVEDAVLDPVAPDDNLPVPKMVTLPVTEGVAQQHVTPSASRQPSDLSNVSSKTSPIRPGPVQKKLKSLDAQAKWRNEKASMIKDLVSAANKMADYNEKKTRAVVQFVKNHSRASAFKMAYMGQQAHLDNPSKRRKYEKIMENISNVEFGDKEKAEKDDGKEDDDEYSFLQGTV